MSHFEFSLSHLTVERGRAFVVPLELPGEVEWIPDIDFLTDFADGVTGEFEQLRRRRVTDFLQIEWLVLDGRTLPFEFASWGEEFTCHTMISLES